MQKSIYNKMDKKKQRNPSTASTRPLLENTEPSTFQKPELQKTYFEKSIISLKNKMQELKEKFQIIKNIENLEKAFNKVITEREELYKDSQLLFEKLQNIKEETKELNQEYNNLIQEHEDEITANAKLEFDDTELDIMIK